MNTAKTYEQRIGHYKQVLATKKDRAALLSWVRLLCFLLIVVGVVLFFKNEMEPIYLLISVAGIASFIFVLLKHQKAQSQISLAATLLKINEWELHQAQTWESLFDDGREFIDEKHDFSGDLDVFGPSSLFQHVNRTGSYSGWRRLADQLRAPLQDANEIRSVQEALKVLTPALDFRQEFLAEAALSNEAPGDIGQIKAWLEMPFQFLHNKFVKAAMWAAPILSVAAIIYYAVEGSIMPLLAVISVNGLILRNYFKEVMKQYILISHKERIMDKFSILLRLVRDGDFHASKLLVAQQQQAFEADTALKKLARISNAFDQRLNLLIGFGLNALMLYDLHCIMSLEKWKAKHKDHIMKWFGVISRLEVWNSLATYAYNHSDYSWPEVVEDKPLVEAEKLGHPLIPANQCVKNDGSVGSNDKFLIITGSNMSGKSTFLRSVGANLLMAMCGAPVCADKFTFSPMQIMTSMRIKDSIASHTSYFQAELLRLQHIIQRLKSGAQVFILLDEILKGTNSEDKLSGSRSLIEHFLQYSCLGMIATHDLELGLLEEENPNRIRNYCFESTIQENNLFFDYRIRKGIATNKNATFLMKQMGIIE
ncbi:hypothetical protein DVR12_08765 [Chitinophaga silvatica]|uniref:DNA mismatch repair proteins mutS family domain-containing protein n=1 Tax=Chitinophaga silvatica TaxID=2282649 RepID=A0A3E1YCI4_9BACT|nr:hypothetical protein [Chitinophaga silvatica]RFS23965.1 hypothetical protein DVR12_08765 [Chitinophaga silvatica]